MMASLLPTLPAVMSALISAVLVYLSYGHSNAEAYLFPQMISSGLLLFSLLLIVRTKINNIAKNPKEIPILRLLPAFILLIAYANAIEWLGMYTSTALMLLLSILLYHSNQALLPRLKIALMLAVLFTATMYVLFSVLLQVQTPKGLFI